MKVIFLDIDGVLNVIPKGHDKWGGLFHDHFVDNLKYIIDTTGAKIVISSTWRMGNGLPGMIEMWNERGLPGEVVGITPNFMTNFNTTLCRGKEIDAYIKDHPEITNYVIIDDDCDMEPHQLENFVMTSGNEDHSDCVDIGYGLTKECSEWAIKILMRNKTPKLTPMDLHIPDYDDDDDYNWSEDDDDSYTTSFDDDDY